jgi:DNA-binding helix-hairpin-helix protein with protein kinase domain
MLGTPVQRKRFAPCWATDPDAAIDQEGYLLCRMCPLLAHHDISRHCNECPLCAQQRLKKQALRHSGRTVAIQRFLVGNRRKADIPVVHCNGRE